MNLNEAVAYRIVDLCNQRGISVNRLANLAGLTQSTVDSILKGKSRSPRLVTLIKISDGLGITIGEFLDDPRINDADIED
ncbi:MAG: helix-turn-helix transcriptional regulator [Syntrophomonas sp.]